MKTVTLNKDNSSIILVDNTTEISLEQDHIKKGIERIYGIHKDNTTLHENVTEPTDWTSGKYFYDGESWTENPNWFDFYPQTNNTGSEIETSTTSSTE